MVFIIMVLSIYFPEFHLGVQVFSDSFGEYTHFLSDPVAVEFQAETKAHHCPA